MGGNLVGKLLRDSGSIPAVASMVKLSMSGRYAPRNTYDPNSYMTSAPTDVSGGIRFPFAGNKGSNDLGDYWHATWKLKDVFERLIPSTPHFGTPVVIITEKTAPSNLSSNFHISAGISYSLQEDINHANGYMHGCGLLYAGGTRAVRVTRISAGAYQATGSVTGAASASIRAAHALFPHWGTAATGWGYPNVCGLDSSGQPLSTMTQSTASVEAYGKGDEVFLTLAVGATSAVVGAETPVFDIQLGYLPMVLG